MAAWALGSIGDASGVAASALVNAMTNESADTLMIGTAASSIGQIGDYAKSAVPELVEALMHERRVVREQAAMALGRLGSAAESARPVLKQLADGDDEECVRKAASAALETTTGPP